MKNMKDVTYCTNSTITEAWAVIIGLPGKIDNGEPAVALHHGQKRIGDFEVQPSFVFVEQRDIEAVPAFWRQQLAWGDGAYLARIGHRYLSVHFLKKGERKYETYEATLRPQIEHWLDAFHEALIGSRNSYPIERVGFGYVNVFSLPEVDFDLSRYLKLNIGVGGECAKAGIAAMEINTEIVHPATQSHVYVNVLVRTESPDTGRITVRTKVEAQKRTEQDFPFTDKAKLLYEIGKAKAAAKEVFFDLATEQTHKLMGAQYASN